MNISKIFIPSVVVLALVMSGCSVLNTQANSQQGTSAGTAASQSQQPQTSATTNTVSGSNVIAGARAAGIDQTRIGSPLKGANMVVSNGIVYYINSLQGNKIFFLDTKMARDLTVTNSNTGSTGSGTSNTIVSGTGTSSSGLSSTHAAQLGDESASEVLVFNNIIYYVNMGDWNKIYTMNTEGTNKMKLVDETARNMELMGDYIYYLNNKDELIAYDTSSQTRYDLQIKAGCFDSDGTKIYYQSIGPGSKYSLYSAGLDGGGALKLSDDAPITLWAQDGELFYTNGWGNEEFYTNTIDGTNRVKLTNDKIENAIYSSGMIYYIDDTNFSMIYKESPDGKSIAKISDVPFVTSMTIDNGTVYFKSSQGGDTVIYKTAG